MQTSISKLGGGEAEAFEALIRIFHEVFSYSGVLPRRSYLDRLLQHPDFWVVVARRGDEIVGGLTVYVLHGYYDEKPSAYVYDVGVKPAYQGKGVGKALMQFVADQCLASGFVQAFVEAEADDAGAIAFYRKTAFLDELRALQFTCIFGT